MKTLIIPASYQSWCIIRFNGDTAFTDSSDIHPAPAHAHGAFIEAANGALDQDDFLIAS